MRCSAHLEDMSDGILSIDLFFHDTVLVYADRGQKIQDGLVHGLETVDNQSDSDPLPTGVTFLRGPLPVFGLFRLADITDVQHDAMERTGIKGLVFVVRRNGNQDVGLPPPHLLAESPSSCFGKIIWIACRSSVSHVTEECSELSVKAINRMTYENSVVLVPEYLASMAL